MFSRGSKALRTPSEEAVRGMSCIRPWAPLLETARGLKADSTRITASTRSAATPWRAAISRISSLKRERMPSGSLSQPCAVPDSEPMRRKRGSVGALVKWATPSSSTQR